MEVHAMQAPSMGSEIRQENAFYDDVVRGLTSTPKFLQSKYFYDTAGDWLFQEIMDSPEYYPTDCESEIFSLQTAGLAKAAVAGGDPFDLIELGAGDASKSLHLLKYLMDQKSDFRYLPIDISGHILSQLDLTLPVAVPGIAMLSLHGEYFDMLREAAMLSSRRKVVLFLGSNIGNMLPADALRFCLELRSHLRPGDMVLVGVDLKKDPRVILAAYNDAGGITKQFNLNLLTRINRELDGDFDTSQFDHFPTYDPLTGTCKSYLVSLVDQVVRVGDISILFEKGECIQMEVSQKYTTQQMEFLAFGSGFQTGQKFFDHKNWFLDAIWVV
ncbi:MAG TPA: L-histidine N(alpha)-methyltransferase [Puia sp.]|nr:L-histidine N(alpha)-methyltransferase [Puia sp.]